MLKVYRVETKDRIGPYHSERGGRHHIDFDAYRQPGPGSDGLGYDHTGFHFGFASLDQLKAWFLEHERAKLAGEGFSISVYNTDTVRKGQRQVKFKLNPRRRLRRRLPLI